MAYQDHIKIRAYTLFLNGTSFEETAKILSKDFKISISANTIKNWSEKKDGKGLSWVDYRLDIRGSARQIIETKEVNRLAAVRDKTYMLAEKLYEQLISDNAPKLKSPEGGAYAYKTIVEYSLKLCEKTQGGKEIAVIIQMVMDIFSEVPEVRKAIMKHWKHIEKEMRGRILQENPESIEAQKMIEG